VQFYFFIETNVFILKPILEQRFLSEGQNLLQRINAAIETKTTEQKCAISYSGYGRDRYGSIAEKV
jgi:hypothetical protein|tara:strand:+ start:1350 stop:1547 length:198 start_codon:yes stop_codon:yes gene_type:complete